MDTIYAEGQRRYVESLSAYARQFINQMQKPRLEHIEGLSPAIAIEQKNLGNTPRSTVGTVTEIYDYLRILMARLGTPHCPACNVPVGIQTIDEIVSIFGEMGFALAEGPDVEDDFHNFTALNIPPEHPAREMQDTFYLPEQEYLLAWSWWGSPTRRQW